MWAANQKQLNKPFSFVGTQSLQLRHLEFGRIVLSLFLISDLASASLRPPNVFWPQQVKIGIIIVPFFSAKDVNVSTDSQ